MEELRSSSTACTQSAAPSVYLNRESKLREAYRDVARLRRLVFDLKRSVAANSGSSLGAATLRDAESLSVAESVQPGDAKSLSGSHELDWEAWARTTKARIRGESLEVSSA